MNLSAYQRQLEQLAESAAQRGVHRIRHEGVPVHLELQAAFLAGAAAAIQNAHLDPDYDTPPQQQEVTHDG